MSPLDSGALLPPAEDEAVLEVQCFAGPRLLRNGEELWPSGAASREQKPMQLLLFLAAHAAEGVDRDKASRPCWPTTKAPIRWGPCVSGGSACVDC